MSDHPEASDCPHRSPDSIGTVNCNCRGMPLVYWCNHDSVQNYVMLTKVRLATQMIQLDDGNRADIGMTVPKDCLGCELRPTSDQNLPPVAKQLLTFSSAVARFVSAGMPRVEPAEYDRRIRDCLACPRLGPEGRCAHCGCWVSEKALWKTEECPEDRWPVDTAPTPRQSRQTEAIEAAIQKICQNCPRFHVICEGPTAEKCPLDLWPSVASQKRPRKRACTGC